MIAGRWTHHKLVILASRQVSLMKLDWIARRTMDGMNLHS